MATKEIPIRNIYYLLCYAWDALDEADLVDVSELDTHEAVNLFATILVTGTQHLIRRGLDRSYLGAVEEIPGIRGKLRLSDSIKRVSFANGRAVCEFDEFDCDVLHNQIIKSTIGRLLYVKEVEKKLHAELKALYHALPQVSEVQLSGQLFSRVQLHRNNRCYLFLIRVCELLYRNILPSEEPGISRLRDFVRDEEQMRLMFQKFVFRFYEKHLREYGVKVWADQLRWHGRGLTADAALRLPVLQTDICLTTESDKVIIDTKFSLNAIRSGRFGERINTGHLYQMFCYLLNVSAADAGKRVTGVLLYPTVEEELDLPYELHGHTLHVKTVNLASDWRAIESRLLQIARECWAAAPSLALTPPAVQ